MNPIRDALQKFLRSDQNILRPPDGLQFAIVTKVAGREALGGFAKMAAVSLLTQPRPRGEGEYFTATLQIVEHVSTKTVGKPIDSLCSSLFMVPITPLARLFETINLFPASAKVYDALPPGIGEKVLLL
jgi:hypothetical protein